MAHHKSAKKRIRQTAKRTLINKARRTRMRNAVKRVRAALDANDAAAAQDALTSAIPELDKAGSFGIIHKNKAARIKSRLTHAVRRLES